MSACAECGCKASEGWALYWLKCSDKQQVDWEAVAADQALTIVMLKQREWVGLTEIDMLELDRKYYPRTFELMIAVEEKLKEKNCG